MLRRKKRVALSMRKSMQRNSYEDTYRKNIKLKKGDSNEEVKHLQEMLMEIRELYPSMLEIEIDGIFENNTSMCVKRFQELMGIYDTGNVDMITWNKLNLIYSKKKALKSNLRSDISENKARVSEELIKFGSKGSRVTELQEYINKVSILFPAIPKIKIDGIFGNETKEAVFTFQRMFSLDADGIVGEITWTTLYNVSLGKLIPNS